MEPNSWEEYIAYYENDSSEEFNLSPLKKEVPCPHDWKSVLLIYNTVYNCKICGVKKEDVEK
mgnify:FL=1